MPDLPVLTLVLPARIAGDIAAERASRSVRAKGPPRRILLQSFQV